MAAEVERKRILSAGDVHVVRIMFKKRHVLIVVLAAVLVFDDIIGRINYFKTNDENTLDSG